MVPVTFITASLPERAEMLGELLASVRAQTVEPSGHLIGVDWPREDCSAVLNRLAAQVQTEWLCPVADDDLLLPDFLERMYAVVAAAAADVVYSYCDHSSWPEGAPQHDLCNRPFDAAALRETNWIPGGCTLIRTTAFRQAGGYPTEGERVRHGADWFLWHRLLDLGARFACVPQVLWTWRYHGANKQTELM